MVDTTSMSRLERNRAEDLPFGGLVDPFVDDPQRRPSVIGLFANIVHHIDLIFDHPDDGVMISGRLKRRQNYGHRSPIPCLSVTAALACRPLWHFAKNHLAANSYGHFLLASKLLILAIILFVD